MPLSLAAGCRGLSVLCIGAHSDDIEIGAGGLVLMLAKTVPELDVHWCVLSAAGERSREARGSAEAFLQGAARRTIDIGGFDDGFFPEQGHAIKEWLARVRERCSPDLILVHRREDAHQDHRELNRLTWNLFRNHTILEYEIPKWDGDLGQPNLYAALDPWVIEHKVTLLMHHFGSQRAKHWFDPEIFRGLARLRGMECRADSRYAEAFVLRKGRMVFDPARDASLGMADAAANGLELAKPLPQL